MLISLRAFPLLACFAVSVGLLGCQEPSSPAPTDDALTQIQQFDLQRLPNAEWAFVDGVLQLSFCRNRDNDRLLASAEELRRWRLIGEVSAFPPGRAEGLALLADFYRQYGVLLYQQSGTVSAQYYRVLVPAHEQRQGSIFNALASVGRDRRICFSAVEQGGH